MENSVVIALVTFYGIVLALAGRGAYAIWEARQRPKENGHGAPNPTATADTLAALLEGEDAPETTIEEKLEALALGIKNLRHRQGMLDGRLNKIAPPAEKGKGNGSSADDVARPQRTRADIMRDWRLKNAGK